MKKVLILLLFSFSLQASFQSKYLPLYKQTMNWIATYLPKNYISEENNIIDVLILPRENCKVSFRYLDLSTKRVNSFSKIDFSESLGCFYGKNIDFAECVFKKYQYRNNKNGTNEIREYSSLYLKLKKGWGPRFGKALWTAQKICMGEFYPEIQNSQFHLKQEPKNLNQALSWLSNNGETFLGNLPMTETMWHFPTGGNTCDAQIYFANKTDYTNSKIIFETALVNLADITQVESNGKDGVTLKCKDGNSCIRKENFSSMYELGSEGATNHSAVFINHPIPILLGEVLKKTINYCKNGVENNLLDLENVNPNLY